MTRAFTPEQRAAISDRGGSRLLAANAGSGKTAVMVERFVEAVVNDGVPVGSILALTFTEKAAGELRDRIRRRLVQLGRHDEARAAEGAWLGTIHGFCARVLRAAPIAAGLDPGFTVLDEAAARRAVDAAWATAVEAWAEREGAPAIDLMAGAGIGLREVVLEAHAELRSRGRPPELPPVAPGRLPDPAALEAARAEASALLATAGAGVRVEAARAALEACEAVLGQEGVPLAGLLEAARLGNGAKVLAEAPCVAYREAFGAFRRACADHHARQAMPLLDGLLREFAAHYERAKAARAGLDFEDLQLEVRDLLAADERLRARWAARFAMIMVDEFQDTNRLQLDILEQLERDNLFAVGDELQSIYGFRHADVTIFRDRAAALGPARTRRLRANFRSREELLDVLNGAFAPIFGEAFAPLTAGGGSCAPAAGAAGGGELQLFDPDRIGADGAPPVELLLTDTKAWEGEDAGSLGAAIPGVPVWRRAEAVRVARRLRREVDGGRRPGDLVVLVRAAASLRLFEQALEEAGLPTYVVGGRGYWSQEQVRDGLAYLSAIANPLDEGALLAVLASPFAGVGPDGLVAAARAGRDRGGLWAALQAGVDAEGPDRDRLQAFTAFFAAERAAAERRPVEVLLDRAVAGTGYDLATLARPGGERRLANLRKLMRLAREYERSEGRDLRGFLAFVGGQDLVQAREGEAALESEGLDAVRLMTIHRAKGLEFPVVCVADLGRAGPAGRPRLMLARDGRVGLRLRALGEPAAVAALEWEALAAERDEAEAAEERRLLYVAMTRAEDRLILSGGVDMTRWPAARAAGPPIDWIAPALLGRPAAAVEAGVEVLDRPFEGRPARIALRLNRPADLAGDALPALPPSSAGTALPAAAKVDPPVWPGEFQPALAPMLRRLSYSSLGSYARCGYRFYLQRGLGLPDVAPPPAATAGEAPSGLDPRVRGSLVHLLLEGLDFRRPVPPAAPAVRSAAATLGAELEDDEVADAAALVGAFSESELCARLARARSVRREAPFAFPLEPGANAPLIHGVVDVVAREADGTTLVVDYKTDRLGAADPADLAERAYGTQRVVYALAALREGTARVEVAHCFLERPERTATASFTAADAPALEERLLELSRGLRTDRFPVAAEPHRELCGTCPGRRALCSHSEELTLREPPPAGSPQSMAGTFSGSGGPS